MLLIWPAQLPSLLQIYAWLFASVNTPSACVSSSPDLLSLSNCLDSFTIPPGYYTLESYLGAQPTLSERLAWRALVQSLLSGDEACASIAVPPELQRSYSVQRFVPRRGMRSYCVLAETSVDCDGYPRGWGHIIVPETRPQVSRDIHFSAPHPTYDMGTIQQATALFEMTGGRSLLLAGRMRPAFEAPSRCITTVAKSYYKTDPAHSPVSQASWVAPNPD